MADNNPALRSSLARLATAIFNFEFTSTVEIGGRNVKHGGCLSQLDEADKLMIAGRENIRAQSVAILASDLIGVAFDEGDSIVLDGDPNWQIKKFTPSPDGAVIVFLLMDGE